MDSSNNSLELFVNVPHDPGEVFTALSSHYTVVAGPSQAEHWTLLDTADWRLKRAGMTLHDRRHGRVGELVLSSAGGPTFTAACGARRWPRRANMLPPSPVRDRVAPAIGVRALLPIASVNVRKLEFRLLDDLDKTRVRARVGQQRLADGSGVPLPMWVSLEPLRGYEPDARRCAELLTAALGVLDGDSDLAAVTLAAAGLRPDSGRPARQLDAQAPAATSIAQVLRGHLDTINANRAGAEQDIDTEFLHDLRTAVRATRSILTLMGELLPGTSAHRFADEFAWVGRLTTPVRDLDVLLLETAGCGGLDIDALDGLDRLRDHLTRHRRRHLHELRDGLAGARMTTLLNEWNEFLHDLTTTELVGPATAEAAAARATDVYRRIAKAARGVDATTPAEELHRLRHRCKRMRYLLDAFSPVYDQATCAFVLKRLKAFQDSLGTVQDSFVQRAYLGDVAHRLSRTGQHTDLIMTIGAVRDRISRRDLATRRELPARLHRFCRPQMRHRIETLGQVVP